MKCFGHQSEGKWRELYEAHSQQGNCVCSLPHSEATFQTLKQRCSYKLCPQAFLSIGVPQFTPTDLARNTRQKQWASMNPSHRGYNMSSLIQACDSFKADAAEFHRDIRWIEKKRLSLAWSHITTLETGPKEDQTVACVLFSSSPPLLFLLWARSRSEKSKEKPVFRTCFFPTRYHLAWLVSCLWVKRTGWKTIWWKAMCLCLSYSYSGVFLLYNMQKKGCIISEICSKRFSHDRHLNYLIPALFST